MSFRDCIQSALDSGRLSTKKAEEAFAAYDEAFERARVDEPEGVADGIAALEVLEEITTLKAAKRHERLNIMQRSHELYTRLMASKDPTRELQEIVVDLEMSQQTVRSIAMGNLDRLMDKYGPKMAGLYVNRNLDDVARAAYGEATSPEAKAHADAIIETWEMLGDWANMYGANIPKNPNARLPQTQEAVRVRAVSEQEFIDDHLTHADWEVMKFGGKLIPVEKREEILRHTYKGIISDGFDRPETAQLNAPGLATRLNRDRFIFYKDADSYLAMQKKYGAGTLYEQTINMVESMAKDIALLKTFGPAADSMREFTKRTALKRAADLNLERPTDKRTLVDKMKRHVELFDDEIKIHSWHVVTADGNWPVQTFGAARSIAVNALLGSSFIPNLVGDLLNAAPMRHVLNMPEISVFRSYSKEFLSSKRAKLEAAQLGVVMESMISLAQGRARYFGALDGPTGVRRFTDISYRLGLANYHTQMIRNAQGKQLLGMWANHAGDEFDDLPFAPFLIERGITKQDWDDFRATPLTDIRGAKFLVPRQMFLTGDKVVAQKFSDAMQLFIRTQVPDVSLRSRRALGEYVDPNSASGQLVRTLGSLFAFPVTIWYTQLRRISEAPGIRNKLVFGARYVTAMTLAGFAIMQMRAITQGKELHDATDADTWGNAMIAGGGFGIVGDLILNNLNMSNSARPYSNPTMEFLNKARKLTVGNAWDAAFAEEPPDTKDVAADAAKFLDAAIPDLWYSRLLFERAIKDDFMQTVDPAGWQRKQQYLQEHEEGMWWAPDEEGPEAPNLETAIGGE